MRKASDYRLTKDRGQVPELDRDQMTRDGNSDGYRYALPRTRDETMSTPIKGAATPRAGTTRRAAERGYPSSSEDATAKLMGPHTHPDARDIRIGPNFIYMCRLAAS